MTATAFAGYDLDAARAARREASGEGFLFRFGGEDFTLPPPREWPIGVTDFLASGEVQKALIELLGPEEMARFKAHRPTVGDMESLFEGLAAWQGMKTGE